MADEVTIESGKRSIMTKVKQEPISDDDVICEPAAKSPKRSDQSNECAVKKEHHDDKPVLKVAPVKIKITVKASKEKHLIKINNDATVTELKEEVSKVFKTPIEQISLIYSGKVLKDPEVLSDHGIEDGHILHLLIKTTTATNANVSASPFGLGAFGGLPGLGTLGLGSPNFLEVQKQMQRELLQNPELLQQVMNNPFVQSMMENPEYMRQIVTSNPQMKEMLDKNPELSHMLSNPEVLRSTMEVAKNPVMLQELIRFRVEKMPTPSSSKTSGSKSPIRTRSRRSRESADENEHVLDKNKESEKEITINDDTIEADNDELKVVSPEKEKSNSESTLNATDEKKSEQSSTEGNSTSPTGTTAGVFTSPGLQSIMQQMVQNPQLVQEMFNAPYMQSMMDALAANPEVASQIMVNNPVFGNNVTMQEQLQQSLPAFIKQMQNPEMQRFVSNPQALSAMMNIHQGLDQLQQVAPNVFNMFPGQPPIPTLFSQTPESNKTTTTAPEKTGSNESNIPTQDTFSFFMRNMVNSMSQGFNTDGPPEEKYQSQLEQMQMMGFSNKQANLDELFLGGMKRRESDCRYGNPVPESPKVGVYAIF